MVQPSEFNLGDYVVYPSHGVAQIKKIEEQQVAGMEVKLYVLDFKDSKMTVSVPLSRAVKLGLRSLSSAEDISKALNTLRKKAKISRGMWSKRAQEYDSKINSGNIISLAEVVRDLHRGVENPERSYSERVIYENALHRFAGEIAAIEQIDPNQATKKVVDMLSAKKAAA
jgi:CarD family transcriptional regulator